MSEALNERRTRALELLEKLETGAPEKVAANFDSLHEDFLEIVLGFAFADVVARPAIDLRTREMMTVAALCAMGTAQGQLEFHIRAAMNQGVTREEVLEIILQMAVYGGVPAAMNGFSAARAAFEGQKAREGNTH